jgi:two-component system, response regulator
MLEDMKLVLLVEDDPDHAELIRRSFANHQVANKVDHVFDGEAALDYLFRRGEFAESAELAQPNLILLDLRLPRIDGMEVLKKIKSSDELKSIPVVILTTSDADADVNQAYRNCANSYLVKPMEFDAFVKLIDELGLYWLTLNRRPQADQTISRVGS